MKNVIGIVESTTSIRTDSDLLKVPGGIDAEVGSEVSFSGVLDKGFLMDDVLEFRIEQVLATAAEVKVRKAVAAQTEHEEKFADLKKKANLGGQSKSVGLVTVSVQGTQFTRGRPYFEGEKKWKTGDGFLDFARSTTSGRFHSTRDLVTVKLEVSSAAKHSTIDPFAFDGGAEIVLNDGRTISLVYPTTEMELLEHDKGSILPLSGSKLGFAEYLGSEVTYVMSNSDRKPVAAGEKRSYRVFGFVRDSNAPKYPVASLEGVVCLRIHGAIGKESGESEMIYHHISF